MCFTLSWEYLHQLNMQPELCSPFCLCCLLPERPHCASSLAPAMPALTFWPRTGKGGRILTGVKSIQGQRWQTKSHLQYWTQAPVWASIFQFQKSQHHSRACQEKTSCFKHNTTPQTRKRGAFCTSDEFEATCLILKSLFPWQQERTKAEGPCFLQCVQNPTAPCSQKHLSSDPPVLPFTTQGGEINKEWQLEIFSQSYLHLNMDKTQWEMLLYNWRVDCAGIC